MDEKTVEELDQAAGETGEVTFSMFMFEDQPESFMLFRNVGEFTTHWMTPNGAWVPLPEDESETERLLAFLAESKDLPRFAELPGE